MRRWLILNGDDFPVMGMEATGRRQALLAVGDALGGCTLHHATRRPVLLGPHGTLTAHEAVVRDGEWMLAREAKEDEPTW
jgi:hypothetical protein